MGGATIIRVPPQRGKGSPLARRYGVRGRTNARESREGKPPKDDICPICNFRTDPPHDGRSHRGARTREPVTFGRYPSTAPAMWGRSASPQSSLIRSGDRTRSTRRMRRSTSRQGAALARRAGVPASPRIGDRGRPRGLPLPHTVRTGSYTRFGGLSGHLFPQEG
jgi:hypothetical protein